MAGADPEDPVKSTMRRWMSTALVMVGQGFFLLPAWVARAVRSVVERDT